MLIAIEKKWLRAAHLPVLWHMWRDMLIQATSGPQRIPSAGPKGLLWGGYTCGPAVQLGDKAMLPASAMRSATEKLSMLDLNLEILCVLYK